MHKFLWAVPYDSMDINQKECIVQASAPACEQGNWSRSNHLGNTLNGETASYKWTLPFFPSKRIQTCVFRIRYNVTTGDYDPNIVDSKMNGRK